MCQDDFIIVVYSANNHRLMCQVDCVAVVYSANNHEQCVKLTLSFWCTVLIIID